MRKRNHFKQTAVFIALTLAGSSMLGGCSCSRPASAEVETSTSAESISETAEATETEEATQPTTEETVAPVSSSAVELSGLVEIFSPSKYLDENSFKVTKTQEQYDTLMAYDINGETHYVDDIIEFIVCEIGFQGEENMTDEDVIDLIEQWAVDGLKPVDQGQNESEAPIEETQGTSEAGYTIIPFGGTWYASTEINIRRTPTTEEDNIVGQLAFAEEIEAEGATSDAKFVRIVYEGEYAFVSASLLQDTKPTRPTQSTQQPSGNEGSGQQGNEGNSSTGNDYDGSGADELPAGFGEGSLTNGQGNGNDPSNIDWDAVDQDARFNGN